MKIAILGHKAIPSTRGGIERVLTILGPLLVKRGLEVTCYNRSSDCVDSVYADQVKDQRFQGVVLKTAPTVRSSGISAAVAALTGALKAGFSAADVVHFHAEGPCAMMWIPRLLGKHCVATVHGIDWKREKWGNGLGAKYIHLGEKIMVHCAHEIIVLTPAAQAYFEETYGRKTVLIPNGVMPVNRRPLNLLEEKFSLKKDDYICTASRLVEEKRIDLLIRAYIASHMQKKLVIAGDTRWDTPYIRSLLAMAEGNPNIIFTGFLHDEEMAELYSNAYAVCLPSNLEGMSLSLLEALSYSNAVLCSDIPENTCVAEEHAVYFKTDNQDDLTGKLRLLQGDPHQVEDLRATAGTYICQKYSWEKIADETCGVYRRKESV